MVCTVDRRHRHLRPFWRQEGNTPPTAMLRCWSGGGSAAFLLKHGKWWMATPTKYIVGEIPAGLWTLL